MRLQSLVIFSLPLLLAACSVETGNDGGNVAPSEAGEPAVAPTGDGTGAAPGAIPAEPAPPAGPPGTEPTPDNGQPPEPSGQVSLTAAPASVEPGATMTLTLRNGTREQLGYNLCTSTLQTGAGRPMPTDRVCTMELRTLDPGRSANYSYGLPGNLGSGSYRFSTRVERMPSGRSESVRSNSFEVR